MKFAHYDKNAIRPAGKERETSRLAAAMLAIERLRSSTAATLFEPAASRGRLALRDLPYGPPNAGICPRNFSTIRSAASFGSIFMGIHRPCFLNQVD